MHNWILILKVKYSIDEVLYKTVTNDIIKIFAKEQKNKLVNYYKR